MKRKSRNQKLFLLFLLLLILLNFPVFSILQSDILVGGIPLKIVLVFSIWLIIIILAGIVINRK
ncbi:MAG: hypothetical protein IPP61_10425 [Cytophagaceae bacterium]|nr:hypothetical protein [Cytophagaceae bacterium]